jgi:hypothetical protein
MKKIINITFIMAVAAIIFSCSKEESAARRNPPPPPPPVIPTPTKGLNFASNWKDLTFSVGSRNLPVYLESSYQLPEQSGYDYTTHRQFAFIKVSGRDSYSLKALPFHIDTNDGTIEFSFSATQKGFNVRIMNLDNPGRKPDIRNHAVNNSQYRFLVVTDSTYRVHSNINWSDHDAVFDALHTTIRFE